MDQSIIFSFIALLITSIFPFLPFIYVHIKRNDIEIDELWGNLQSHVMITTAIFIMSVSFLKIHRHYEIKLCYIGALLSCAIYASHPNKILYIVDHAQTLESITEFFIFFMAFYVNLILYRYKDKTSVFYERISYLYKLILIVFCILCQISGTILLLFLIFDSIFKNISPLEKSNPSNLFFNIVCFLASLISYFFQNKLPTHDSYFFDDSPLAKSKFVPKDLLEIIGYLHVFSIIYYFDLFFFLRNLYQGIYLLYP